MLHGKYLILPQKKSGSRDQGAAFTGRQPAARDRGARLRQEGGSTLLLEMAGGPSAGSEYCRGFSGIKCLSFTAVIKSLSTEIM